MTSPARISGIQFTRGSESDEATGLVGYVSFWIDDRVLVDGVTVRRTRGGELRLAYAARRDWQGRDHPYVLPDAATRRVIEDEVFRAVAAELAR